MPWSTPGALGEPSDNPAHRFVRICGVSLFEPLCVDLPGLTLAGLRAGRGRPLLLLHGWPEWSHAWRPLMNRLADRHALFAPDLRGFGDSRKPGAGPDDRAGPEVLAADILALADRLGLARFGLVSHDVGSFVAQAIARQAPGRVAGLFFFNCAYPGIGSRWIEARHLPETWYQYFHQLPWAAELVGSSRQTCRLYIAHFLRHWSHRQEWIEAELERWTDNFMKPGNLQGGFDWYGSVRETRLAMIEGRTEPAPPIALPTRVLWGAHDPVLKAAWTDRLHEHFSDLRVDLQPDAGHFVHLEVPDAAAAEIADFFARLRFD